MSVERTSGVAGPKFVAYFALFTNVTYLSEDLPFGRSFILLLLSVGYSHTERQRWRTGGGGDGGVDLDGSCS